MMTKLTSVFLLLTIALAGSAVKAAESVDQAVTQIAEQFVAARANAENPVRLAVTPFVQSGRNTQFSDLLLIALTGKMVQQGAGKFQVIEKAQFERALREITVSEGIDIFDPDTAQKLGKFLSVETLIVGEITPLTDSVRVDARLVMVETIELLEQASVWIPLTPTVRRQLDAVTRRQTVSLGDDGPDLRNGIWTGTGQCGDLSFGLALSLLVNDDDTLIAMQSYYPTGAGDVKLEPGVFTMEGTIDPDNGEFTLSPESWMHRPRGHSVSGFSGVLNEEAGTIKATYSNEGCSDVRLRKAG